MKSLLRAGGLLFVLATGAAAPAAGAAAAGTIDGVRNDRSQDDDMIAPEEGGDAALCRYRSRAGNCLRPMLTDPSDCLSVRSSKIGAPGRRPRF